MTHIAWLRRLSLNRAGDTLVEVLISILIVSSILTGAYVTTNNSAKAVRDAQEHAEALKLVQGQLEQVRYSAKQAGSPVFSQPLHVGFCMIDGTVSPHSDYPPCRQDGSGNPTTSEPVYRLNAVLSDCAPDYTAPAPATCRKLTVSATWTSVTSSANASEVVTARLYQ